MLEALSQATLSGYNQYPAGDGVLVLREQLAKQFYNEINCNSILSPKLPLPLAQPLRFFVPFKPVSMQMMKLLFLTRAMTAMPPAVQLAGGTSIHIHLEAPTFQVNWQKLDCINAKLA